MIQSIISRTYYNIKDPPVSSFRYKNRIYLGHILQDFLNDTEVHQNIK